MYEVLKFALCIQRILFFAYLERVNANELFILLQAMIIQLGLRIKKRDVVSKSFNQLTFRFMV